MPTRGGLVLATMPKLAYWKIDNMYYLIGLCILTVSFFGCATPRSVPPETNKVVRKEILESPPSPKGDEPRLNDEKTKKVTLGDFTMEIRDSMKKVKVVPIDSSLWRFIDGEMTIAIEQGIYNDPLKRRYGDLDYLEFQKVIDGEECKITTLRFADTSEHTEPEKLYAVNARFNESPRAGDPISIFVTYKNAESRQIALDIIDSVRFSVNPKAPPECGTCKF